MFISNLLETWNMIFEMVIWLEVLENLVKISLIKKTEHFLKTTQEIVYSDGSLSVYKKKVGLSKKKVGPLLDYFQVKEQTRHIHPFHKEFTDVLLDSKMFY